MIQGSSFSTSVSTRLVFAGVFLFAAFSSSVSAQNPPEQTEYQRVVRHLSPAFGEQVEQYKEAQRQEAEASNNSATQATGAGEILFVGEHPVVVVTTDDSGELIATEF